MNNTNIREVLPTDAAALVEIYRPSIEQTAASFEIESPTVSEFRNRIIEITKSYPWLVYEKDNVIAGYAYAGPHRSRPAYIWSADVTIYIAPVFTRQGIAKALYQNLFEIVKRQGVANLFAGITLPNEASISLHESLGFEHIGTYKNVGFKMKQWWDVGWWQLNIQLPDNPSGFIAYPDLQIPNTKP